MKQVVCETATIADAVMRAARVAPVKGTAWDKAAGILLEVRPSTSAPLRVKATDLDVTFLQKIAVLEVGDEAADWRLPSSLISGFLKNLPMTPGKTVTLTEQDNIVHLKSGRSRARIRRILGDFPKIGAFDPASLIEVSNFAQRVQQVAWAVHSETMPFTGIHIDGERLIGCDRIRVAVVPCAVPVEKPITAPLGSLTSLLAQVGDVRLRATDTRLEIMPDDDTQMSCLLYQAAYPNVLQLLPELQHEVGFFREAMLDALNRMLVLVKGERYPKIRVQVNESSIDLEMALDDVGEVSDQIDAKDGPADPWVVWFSPVNLLAMISHAQREVVTMKYGGTNRMHPVNFVDESGYDVWLMPIQVDEA